MAVQQPAMMTNDGLAEEIVLRTPVWLLRNLTGSEPGLLEFGEGRLAFTTEDGRVFNVSLDQLTNVVFPWHSFGGGATFTIGDQEYRFSFVRPNGADDIPGRLLAQSAERTVAGPAALLTAGRKVKDIGEGRRAGKAWKAVLTSLLQT